MDVYSVVGKALGYIKALVNLLGENSRWAGELAVGLDFIKRDLDMIKGHLEEDTELHLQPGLQLRLQELAYDIDDFVHGLWVPGPTGGFMLSATGLDPRCQHMERIEFFKSSVMSLKEELARSSKSTECQGCSATPAGRSLAAGSTSVSYAPERYLVGITKPKQEIVDLLSQHDGPLKVISIVGPGGLGKTALARKLYDDDKVTAEFHRIAWVVASGNSPADVLNKILQQVDPAGDATSEAFKNFPKNKRYLVFIDDMQRGGIEWNRIEEAFSENDMGSRIILTTRVLSIAAAYSSGSYMYTMRFLGETESEELFWRNARRCQKAPAGNLARGSENIFLKCGGLPLPLITAGKYLSEKGRNLKRDDCECVGNGLGSYLNGNEIAFRDMKRVLAQCYNNLPDHDHRNCLLYTSLYPSGHKINNKSLVRKLLAEELVAPEPHVRKCLEELIDQSMIERVLVRNDSKVDVERCKVHSTTREFALQKAVSRNLVSFILRDQVPPNTRSRDELLHNTRCSVRRLAIQSSREVSDDELRVRGGVKLSSVRSLTVFHSGIPDFKGCRIMRVLDLEGCNEYVCTRVVDGICKLVFLKYLSLRNTRITTLPTQVKKLKCLETLDIRETGVDKLPIQVIILPQLASLFGKFELPRLPDNRAAGWLMDFLQKRSKLHTLAGIIINGTVRDFELLILHARGLKKVKIWFRGDSTSPTLITRSLKRKFAAFIGYLKNSPAMEFEETTSRLVDTLVSSLKKRFTSLDSVSIDFNGVRNNFLCSVQAPCTISSIKLWGELERLPQPDILSQLGNLRKLHLFSTGLRIEALTVLQTMEYLEYLKLTEDRHGSWDGRFVIQADGFPSLHILCLEAGQLPMVMFERGSMASLNSLQLLYPRSPTKVEDISHLASLNEVILHHSAPDATVDAWKDAAMLHINRPYVKKLSEPNRNAP